MERGACLEARLGSIKIAPKRHRVDEAPANMQAPAGG